MKENPYYGMDVFVERAYMGFLLFASRRNKTKNKTKNTHKSGGKNKGTENKRNAAGRICLIRPMK